MTTPSLSIRLPQELRERLEQAAIRVNRSRSFLVQEALTRHLQDVEAAEIVAHCSARREKLLALKGIGTRLHGARNDEDIQSQIREFRGDE